MLPLVDGMCDIGWNVTAVCSDGKEIRGLRAQGYTIKTIAIARSMNPWLALQSLLRLTLFFRTQSFDVLHVHTPVAALIGRLAAKLSGIPFVVYTAHGFYFHDDMPRWKRAFFVMLEQLGGRFTDLLFCQSSEDADVAINHSILPSNQVVAIGNGVNVARFNPACTNSKAFSRQSLGLPLDSFVVGLIGRQVVEKGIVEFLQAISILAERYPHLWVLLVGERLDSDHAKGVTLELAACKAKMGERLVVLGLREDIPELLAAMDLFCLPSWREGMPRTIIEAMMMAKPVVATSIRGSREEVIPEHTGLLVPVRSPSLLSKAIERFLVDPELALRFGEAGRQRALELYDERRVVELQISIIRDRLRSVFACH